MPSLAIYGDSGMGKTMLMKKFCEDHPPLVDPRKGIERQQVLSIQLAGKPGERQLFTRSYTRSASTKGSAPAPSTCGLPWSR